MAQKKSPEGIQYSGFFDALFKIPRQEGVMALYKARPKTLGRTVYCFTRTLTRFLVSVILWNATRN